MRTVNKCTRRTVLAGYLLLLTLNLDFSSAFTQEFVLYDQNQNLFNITDHTPDMSAIWAAGNWNTVCLRGIWFGYSGLNFDGINMFVYHDQKMPPLCIDITTTTLIAKSIRYGADSDSTKTAISIYSGTWYEGREVFATTTSLAGTDGKSFSISGPNRKWTFFEGLNFNGKSICFEFESRDPDVGGRYDVPMQLNLTQIGSARVDCVTQTPSPVLVSDSSGQTSP